MAQFRIFLRICGLDGRSGDLLTSLSVSITAAEWAYLQTNLANAAAIPSCSRIGAWWLQLCDRWGEPNPVAPLCAMSHAAAAAPPNSRNHICRRSAGNRSQREKRKVYHGAALSGACGP